MTNNRICPHCGEYALRKMGFTKHTGYQRYKCLHCLKWSSDSPFIRGSFPKGVAPKPKSIQDLKRRKERRLKQNDINIA